jgi:hypothetical protein
MKDLLTQEERGICHDLGQIAGRFAKLYAKDAAGGECNHPASDINEVVAHIHDLQARIMSRAAVRAYPGNYRLL